MNGKEQFGSKLRGLSRQVLLSFLIAALIASMGWGAAYAFERTSANYSASIDALTGGGGETASTSYRELDGAVGQGVFFGEATSMHYRDQSGVIQAWPGPKVSTAAQHWNEYDKTGK